MTMESALSVCCIFLILTLCCQFAGGKVQICPHSCICSGGNIELLNCLLVSENDWTQTCSEISRKNFQDGMLINLKIRHSEVSFFPNLNCLPRLNSLDLSGIALKNINAHTFHNVNIITQLDLSINKLTDLSFEAFSSLESTQALNLSNNLIQSVTNKTFKGLSHLHSLDLSYNRLVVIDTMTFTNLKNLRYLNLAQNSLVFFSSRHLPMSSNLRVLKLQGNKLQNVDIERANSSSSPIGSLSTLDISNNPIDCSCMLDYLIKNLQRHIKSLDNPLMTTCSSPEHLENLSVLHLNDTVMTCSSPRNIISYPTHEKTVLFKDVVRLECRSDGYPPPAIVWITPWREIFAHAPTVPLAAQYGFTADDLVSHKQYEERNVDIVTRIEVNEENDLIISGFRGSFSGNYTCLAFNVAGNKSEYMHLSITSMMKPVYITSLLIGGYTASGTLIFAFIVGFIKMNIVRLRHKNCFRVPIFSTAPSIRAVRDTLSSHYDSTGRDDANLNDFSPGSIDCSEAERLSKDFAQNSGSPTGKRPLPFIESFEEARERFRSGMGRKVESMRRNVQSIKDSSSAYVHNIMESGSSAASRMKASVAQGVETVKSHVQSFRELCGSGDMGMQTISMISVETDIDTNQQTSIVKQITYV